MGVEQQEMPENTPFSKKCKSVPVHNLLHTFSPLYTTTIGRWGRLIVVWYPSSPIYEELLSAPISIVSRIYANPRGCEVYNNFAELRGIGSPTYSQFMVSLEPIAPEGGGGSNNVL